MSRAELPSPRPLVPASAPAPSSRRQLSTVAFCLVLFDAATALEHRLLAARLVALILVVIVPGAQLTAAAKLEIAGRLEALALVVGGGLAVVMAWAALASAVLPHLGIDRPLERGPLVVAYNLIIVVLCLACPPGVDPILVLFPGTRPRRSGVTLAGGCLLVCLGSVAGVERLNNGHGSALVQVAVIGALVLLIVSVVQAGRWSEGRLQAALFASGLALIYLYAYRSNRVFGFDIQQEYQRFSFTYQAAIWTPPRNGDPYAAMLSITALPAALSRLTALSGVYLFKGLYPLTLAFVPGLTFSFVRRWLPVRAALCGAIYLLALPQFSNQISELARQEVGLFYFALLIMVLYRSHADRRRRLAVALMVFAALVVSHYSTSYVAAVLLSVTALTDALVGGVRRNRGRPGSAPAIGMAFSVLGVCLVLGWDVVVTHSAGNVMAFAVRIADQGPNVLPNGNHGSLVNRWLAGNLTPTVAPSKYYSLAESASRRAQPWIVPYPSALTSRYPAEAAPPYPSGSFGVPLLNVVSTYLEAAVSEVLLVLTIVGTGAIAFSRRRGLIRSISSEVAVLGLVFMVFVAIVRLSGTVAGSYNQERAQVQAGMILALGTAVAVRRLFGRLPQVGPLLFLFGISVFLLGSTGLLGELAGAKDVTLANSGRTYDQFFVSDQEAAGAHWLIAEGGRHPIIWTDQYGELRFWDATSYAAATQLDLTPATLSQGAWVYATAYNLQGRAYGQVAKGSSTYRFPERFLHTAEATVYSSPEVRIYQGS